MRFLSPLIRCSVAALICLAALGCTSATVNQRVGSTHRSVRIATVSVTPAESLSSDDLSWIRENTIESTLTSAIRQQLASTGKYDPAGASLDVKIVSMRLRSTAMAVMWGVMAGSDHLLVEARVIEKGNVVKTFTAEANRTSGAFAGPGSLGRAERMCEELANSLVQQL